EGSSIGQDRLSLTRRVMLDGEPIGSLYIESDLGEMHARVRRYGVIILGVLLLSSLVALVLASQLQGLISGPVLRLADAARRVTEERDFSVRAQRTGSDEIGVLIDGINDTLAHIQMR